MMKNITTLLLIGILCLIVACNKDDAADNSWGIPDATQTGENTFGCLVNGEPWVAGIATDIFAPGLYELSANYDEIGSGIADNFYFWVNAEYFPSSKDSSIRESMFIDLRPIYSEGNVPFSTLDRQNASFNTGLFNINNTYKIYRLDTLSNNYINITTLDTVSNVCAGLFSLQLINEDDLMDTIHITNGRFDVRYQPD